MSINTFMKYPASNKNRYKTIITPCNPRDIKFYAGKYYVNYVLLNAYGEATPRRVSFKTYSNAYLAMNEARVTQGFQKLPPFKPFRG